jgi:integrase
VHLTTFAEAAERFIAGNEPAWRNSKHRQQVRNTLATYAAPMIGSLPVKDITTAHLMQIREPIWNAKPETATRVRGRIESVLNFARVQGWRDDPNPATWRGQLQLALPARRRVRAVKHHAALPWLEMSQFLPSLRQHEGGGARALEFCILTAACSGEAAVRGGAK